MALLLRLGCTALLLSGFRLGAADDLPKRVPGERPGEEPRLMLNDLPDIPLPPPVTAAESVDPVAVVSLERAKAELERARGRELRWQKLAQGGVLSQVEAESTVLQVARALVKYQTALAAQAAAQAEALRARREKGESNAEELAAAETAQRTTAAQAAEAAAQLQRQQRLAAEANLGRQRRLFALGIGSRGQLQRAQSAVEKLPANPAAK